MSGPQKNWSTPPEGPTDPQALQCCLIRGTSPGGVRQKEHRLPARQAPRKTVGSLGNQWETNGKEKKIQACWLLFIHLRMLAIRKWYKISDVVAINLNYTKFIRLVRYTQLPAKCCCFSIVNLGFTLFTEKWRYTLFPRIMLDICCNYG